MTNAYLMLIGDKNFARIPVTLETDDIVESEILFDILTNDTQFAWVNDTTEMEVFLADNTKFRRKVEFDYEDKELVLIG